MAFLLVRDLGSTSDSTPVGGEGIGGEGVNELLLDSFAAPPGLPCSKLDPILDSTGTGVEGVGWLPPDLLMAPPDLPCPKLDPVLNLTPCKGGGVCEYSWGPPEAFSGPPWAGLDSSLDSKS